jgi:uroporphyrin-III C-methyltransferase
MHDTINKMQKNPSYKHKLVLAGAGPGDPGLITVKAAERLREAEVILVDRLVSNEIISLYANPNAEIVEVGKQCRRGVSTSQQTINELLVYYAAQGKRVVRLKGGDIAFFSNILDELQILVANGIPFEIIPGVTAASGAAAYAGIPLTARGYATGVRFLTCYDATLIGDEAWKDLAHSNDTLVCYMSAETIGQLVGKLLEHGIDGEKQLAVIEQATTAYQKVYTAPLKEFVSRNDAFLSPSLIIIGKVVELRASFDWFASANPDREYYFKPLTATLEQMVVNDTKNRYADRA